MNSSGSTASNRWFLKNIFHYFSDSLFMTLLLQKLQSIRTILFIINGVIASYFRYKLFYKYQIFTDLTTNKQTAVMNC